MRYQQILDALKTKREASIRDSYGVDAAAARKYFGENLDRADAGGVFRYKKNNVLHVYKKDKDVMI